MDAEPAWRPAPPDLPLTAGQVHVWRAGLDLQPGVLRRQEKQLSADERERAACIRVEQARDRFVAGRAILRAVLGRYLDVEPKRVEFAYTEQGKPYLSWPKAAGALAFNLSHSRGLALVAVTCGRQVGADLEWLRPVADAEAIAARFFSAREAEALRWLPPEQRLEGFFACWTRKEACLKATAGTLLGTLGRFSVSLAPGERARLLEVEGDPSAVGRWSLVSFRPAPGYLAALAIEGQPGDLVWLEWPPPDGVFPAIAVASPSDL
jgi:4'-phosphopantetheinyl transferase